MKWLLLLSFLVPASARAQSIPTTYTLGFQQSNSGDVVAYQAPLIYQNWWNEVKLCSNITNVSDKNLIRLRWFSVAGNDFMAMGHGPYIGYTYAWDNEIWIAQHYTSDERVVKHEMLHYMLWLHGDSVPGHPIEFIKCNLV